MIGISEKIEQKKKRIERVYTGQQWMKLIEQSQRRKPIRVVNVKQSIMFNVQGDLAPSFKKVFVTATKQKLQYRNIRICKYSANHSGELWVKYSYSEGEEWKKFPILKRGKPPLTLPATAAYRSRLQVKAAKAADVMKLVNQYVPAEYRDYYSYVSGDKDGNSSSDSDSDWD